jgi:hypothetical protein
MLIEPDLPIDSKSRCETTTVRENELFWTEKFVVSIGLNFYAPDRRLMSALPRNRTNSRRVPFVRFVPILLQKSLMASARSDSLIQMRFAVEAGDDGAAQSRSGSAVLFI